MTERRAPSKKHAWRNWRKLPPSQAAPTADPPMVDFEQLTPRASRTADAAALDVALAVKPSRPPGRQ